jgi:hypothetical protein
MEIRSVVHNGVIVLEKENSLPEGTIVTIVYPVVPSAGPKKSKRRISVPLVPSDRPGSVRLTGKRIAEILDDEESERVQFPLIRSDQPATLHLTAERIAEIWQDDDVPG